MPQPRTGLLLAGRLMPPDGGRRPVLLASTGLVLAALPAPGGGAAAHAVVAASEPVAGAVLAAPPARISVRFNSRIDRDRSRLALIGPDGTQTVLGLGPATAPTLLEAPAPTAGLAPGPWRLRWQVLAVDGHITRGDIPFTIQPPPR